MNFEVRSDLRGCLEAAMASEATMAVRGNMHMDARVIKVADFKSKVIYIYIYDLQGHLEAAMASEATKAVRGNMHIDTWVIRVADFKSEVT